MTLHRSIGEAIIQLTYGKLEDKQGRDYIQLSIHIAEILAFAVQGYVVDLFPALRYLPKWLPGMKFKRDAAQWKKEISEIESTVCDLVKEQMLSDDPEVQSSFMFRKSQDLENKHEHGQNIQQQREDETVLAWSGLSIYLVGFDTTEAAMQSFIRAMTLFQSVQEKAQAEIDRVVGSGRPPTFGDQADLPYLHTVILETLRWNPVATSGLPHASSKDDVYEGYFIPKGTTVMANAW
ncbi:hypothetical protein FRC00_004509 [Tulasnella sp. 408]|nr:hypothetical protein FRC00_004509 [Tulasnella sp. 408]